MKIQRRTLVELMKTSQFRHIILMNFLSALAPSFVSSASRMWAMQSIKDEQFLSTVASLTAIVSSLKIVFSFSIQYYSYKISYGCLILIQSICCFMLPYTIDSIKHPLI
jgi:hypothetical protein